MRDTSHLPHIVYMHTNVLTGKSYVGFTCKTIKARWRCHVHDANGTSTTCRTFLNSIRKHGTGCWLHTVLEECPSRKEAALSERRWIAELQTQESGYNLTSGGDAAFVVSEEVTRRFAEKRRGHVVTEETRRKISRSKKGIPMKPEHRVALLGRGKGRKATPEQKAILAAGRLAMRGTSRGPLSEATKQKLREKAVLRRPSEETRRRMSEAGKRRAPPSKETLEKMRVAMLGRKHTEEEKLRLSEKARQRVWTPEMKAQAAENLKKAQAKGAWNKGVAATPAQREHLRQMALRRGPVSQESIDKRRQKMLGRKMSPEAIEKSAAKRRGRKLSEAHVAKLRARKMSDEQKAKLSAYRKTWRASDETKRKMSESQKRAWAEHPEAYENMIKAKIGVPLTEEQKRKIGEKNRIHALERSARKRAKGGAV